MSKNLPEPSVEHHRGFICKSLSSQRFLINDWIGLVRANLTLREADEGERKRERDGRGGVGCAVFFYSLPPPPPTDCFSICINFPRFRSVHQERNWWSPWLDISRARSGQTYLHYLLPDVKCWHSFSNVCPLLTCFECTTYERTRIPS